MSAGTGNWLTDEVLHSAGIHPSERACDMDEHQIKALQGALLDVTQTAVDAGADSEKYPAGWLFHGRWAPKKAPAHIAFLKIGGRVSACGLCSTGGNIGLPTPPSCPTGGKTAAVQNLKTAGEDRACSPSAVLSRRDWALLFTAVVWRADDGL